MSVTNSLSVTTGNYTLLPPNQGINTFIGLILVNNGTAIGTISNNAIDVPLAPQTIANIPISQGTLSLSIDVVSGSSELYVTWFNIGEPFINQISYTSLNTGVVEISNATIPVSGSIDANITNASIPVTGNLDVSVTNASIPVTGNVAITSGTVNANITNASIPITGNVTADISNATIPITGNVGITSGTVDATITNATLNIAPASGATFEMTTNALSPPSMVIPDPIILTGNALAFTDASGQLGAQNVAVTVLPSQTNRAYLAIQNLSSGDLWFNVLTTATETSGSILLSSGVGFEYTTAVPTGAISMISNVANCPYTLHYVTK